MNACGTCGQQLSPFARTCPVCRTPAAGNLRRFRRAGLLAAGALALAAAALAARTSGPLRSYRTERKDARVQRPVPVKLETECSVVPVALDRAALDELLAIPSARFGLGYGRMLRESRVIELPLGTRGILLEREDSHARLRVKLGDAEREVWAPAEWLRDADADWTPSVREPGRNRP